MAERGFIYRWNKELGAGNVRDCAQLLSNFGFTRTDCKDEVLKLLDLRGSFNEDPDCNTLTNEIEVEFDADMVDSLASNVRIVSP